ncbi:MAG: thioesterase family protein, partial [Melioribacteraceae bacterium]
PMDEFLRLGYTWVASSTSIDFLREIKLGEKILVRTQVDSFEGAHVKVNFWIVKADTNKIAAEGHSKYALISTANGRPVRIPEEIIHKYTI